MITFERLGGWGLGNSLFQIATTVAIAIDNNTDYSFPDDCNFRRVRYNENGIFKKELPWVKFNEVTYNQGWGIGDIKYQQPPMFNHNTKIDGFFQSEKYFKHIREEILNLFDIKDDIKDYLKEKYKDFLEQKSCTIHVRRNDYFTARELRVLDVDYYKSAIKHFDSDTHYVIFSDDIEWCKNNFDFLEKKTFIEENHDLKEMYLMSFFKNNIIANSTYSWWGAWLGDNNKVVMPNPETTWFSDIYYEEHKHNKGFNDLICKNWIIS
jgi:hypothetical protein